ncbi:MAG: hypothetical protein E6J64_03395 [Deltaproteobacteria bacterium]|nr:MAG: hypothetical protein E6J64_03395 [Deltaproteobacteria bacterium]
MKYPVSLLFFLAALPAAAADIRVDGSYRLRLNGESNYLLDGSGARLGQERWMEHRLRLTPKIIEQDQIEVQGSFDVLRGLVAGDLAPAFQDLGWQGRSNRDGVHASGFDFRHLFVKFRLPFGVFEFGQMPSDWGMGMLINGGNQEEGPDFGDVRFGDIVDRVLFATRPFGFLGPRSEIAQHVALALAADLIYRDRNAQLVTTTGTGGLHWGDVASQLVAALVWDPGPESRAGLYVARRWQQYAAGGGSLHTWLVDLHARTLFPLEWLGGTVSLEAEAAEIYGSTTHSPNLSALFRSQVGQQGVAARALLSRGTLEAEVEGGYASGDSNPFDDAATQFQFSRDFKVGLVLFDEVLLFQTQNAARRLADPSLGARPAPGVDLLPTEGAVANALYLKPTLRWRPSLFGGRLRLVGSALFARAAQPYVDPYNTLVGGGPLNPFGAAPGKNYGTEIDGAISWRSRLRGDVGYELGAQAGRLFPGNAFQMADGSRLGPVNAVRFRATLVF